MHMQRNGVYRFCLALGVGIVVETPRWSRKDDAFLSICHSGRESVVLRATRSLLSFVSVYRHQRSFGSVIQTEGAVLTHRNHPPCVRLPIDNYWFAGKYLRTRSANFTKLGLHCISISNNTKRRVNVSFSIPYSLLTVKEIISNYNSS